MERRSRCTGSGGENGPGRRPWTPSRRAWRRAIPGALLLAWSWWVVGLPPFSDAATAAVLGSGAAAAAAGMLRRPADRVATRPGQAVGWAVLALVGGSWQLAAYLQHPRSEHPTLSSLTNSLLDSQPARSVAFVLWVVAAAGVARR